MALSPNVPEDWVTISNVGSELSRLINQAELKHGIPAKNTIIGGFSMGGAMAIHLGFKFKPEIAGVFALSSFLPPDSLLYKVLKYLLDSSNQGAYCVTHASISC